MTNTPKHEATDAMGMESQRDEGALSGKSGEDLSAELTRIRDKFLIPTPDKDFTDYAIITRCIERLATTQPAEQSGAEGFRLSGNPFGTGLSEPKLIRTAEQSASSPVEGEGPNQLALDICEREIDGWDRLSAGKKTDIRAAVLSALTTRSVAVSSEAVDDHG